MFNFTNIFRIQKAGTTSSPQKAIKHDFHKEAIVDEPIYPHESGRVCFQGSCWPARCEEEITLKAGDRVYVVGIDNITLLVARSPFHKSLSQNQRKARRRSQPLESRL